MNFLLPDPKTLSELAFMVVVEEMSKAAVRMVAIGKTLNFIMGESLDEPLQFAVHETLFKSPDSLKHLKSVFEDVQISPTLITFTVPELPLTHQKLNIPVELHLVNFDQIDSLRFADTVGIRNSICDSYILYPNPVTTWLKIQPEVLKTTSFSTVPVRDKTAEKSQKVVRPRSENKPVIATI